MMCAGISDRVLPFVDFPILRRCRGRVHPKLDLPKGIFRHRLDGRRCRGGPNMNLPSIPDGTDRAQRPSRRSEAGQGGAASAVRSRARSASQTTVEIRLQHEANLAAALLLDH